jgi:hypothetical protein
VIRDVGSHATSVEETEHAGLRGSQCVWRVNLEGSEFAVTVESTQRNIPGKASNPLHVRILHNFSHHRDRPL